MVLHWGQFCPAGASWQCLETFLVVTTRVEGTVLLVSSGWRAETLLHILQCTGQLPSQAKSHPASNVKSSKLGIHWCTLNCRGCKRWFLKAFKMCSPWEVWGFGMKEGKRFHTPNKGTQVSKELPCSEGANRTSLSQCRQNPVRGVANSWCWSGPTCFMQSISIKLLPQASHSLW